MMANEIGNLGIGVSVDTSEVEEAIEKTGELCDMAHDFSPMVSIRGCKSCTFNIYPSRTTINENGPILIKEAQ
ncbi:MAG: hypothetical protein IKE22_13835 [Atopobiaceae bacterium]|nr:hypothetical protein [Atopobiaceae bacterium]